MIILVTTGGRDYRLSREDYQLLEALDPSQVFVGDATGADYWVRKWAGSAHTEFKADWGKYGIAAGPIRNETMLKAAQKEDRCLLLAFPGGTGTKDCINKALQLDIPVIERRRTWIR